MLVFIIINILNIIIILNIILSRSSTMQMNAQKPLVAAAIAAAMIATPAFGKAGEGPKFGFFDGSPSSPFTIENREDPIYSPYSPFGNGEKAVYNGRKGGSEEISFWTNQLNTALKRVDNVPALANKKNWQKVKTELTSYSYNLREAINRLAAASSDPKAAAVTAKSYFSHLNDMFEFSTKKSTEKILASYEASLKDMDTFKTYLK